MARAEVQVRAGIQRVDGLGKASLAALGRSNGNQTHGCDPVQHGREQGRLYAILWYTIVINIYYRYAMLCIFSCIQSKVLHSVMAPLQAFTDQSEQYICKRDEACDMAFSEPLSVHM